MCAEDNKNQIIDKITDISKFSYDQEMDRHKQLLNKSDNLIKYISTLFVIVSVIFPFALNNKILSVWVMLFIYLFICTPVILSLYFSIKVQKLRDVRIFPTGDKVIGLLKENPAELGTIDKIKNKIISYYSAASDSLEKCNNDMSIWLRNSHNFYLLSLVFIIISMVILVA